jgi:hypothetical protein
MCTFWFTTWFSNALIGTISKATPWNLDYISVSTPPWLTYGTSVPRSPILLPHWTTFRAIIISLFEGQSLPMPNSTEKLTHNWLFYAPRWISLTHYETTGLPKRLLKLEVKLSSNPRWSSLFYSSQSPNITMIIMYPFLIGNPLHPSISKCYLQHQHHHYHHHHSRGFHRLWSSSLMLKLFVSFPWLTPNWPNAHQHLFSKFLPTKCNFAVKKIRHLHLPQIIKQFLSVLNSLELCC